MIPDRQRQGRIPSMTIKKHLIFVSRANCLCYNRSVTGGLSGPETTLCSGTVGSPAEHLLLCCWNSTQSSRVSTHSQLQKDLDPWEEFPLKNKIKSECKCSNEKQDLNEIHVGKGIGQVAATTSFPKFERDLAL